MKRALILLLLVCLALAQAADFKDFKIKQADSDEEIKVIVKLKEPHPRSLKLNRVSLKSLDAKKIKRMEIRASQEQVLSSVGTHFKVKHKYGSINALAGSVDKEGLEELQNNPLVEAVFMDLPVKAHLDDSRTIISADLVNDMRLNYTNITGVGETVCVLDSGINYAHPAFGSCTTNQFLNGNCPKVIGGYDYVNNDNDPMDDYGHGSHVSGIIASSNDTYRGIAPDAKIIAIKVLNHNGDGSLSDVAAGIEWCRGNASVYNISVITLSLGTSTTYNATTCPYDPTRTAINNAYGDGILVTISSGNLGSSTGISYPACVPNATSVGSTNKDDTRSWFTNYASILDLLAPGNSILSVNYAGGFVSKSGTSMAAPHVAAAGALLKQYYKLRYGINISLSTLETTLKETGFNVTFGSYNFSRINLYAAAQKLDNNTFPGLVTNLNNVSSGVSWIYWNWSNPADVDYAYAEIWINDSLAANVSAPLNYYNATGLRSSSEYNISVFSVDNVGNKNSTAVNDTGISGQDVTPPSITLLSPQNGSSFLPGELINLSVTDDGLLDLVWYNFDNGNNETLNLPYSINTSNLTRGAVLLYAFANDTGSNVNESIFGFTVNNSAPVFSPALTNQITYETANFIYDINATDNDNDVLSFFDNVTEFDINGSTGLINWTPSHSDIGNLTVEINVSDGIVNVTGSFIITVNYLPDLFPLNLSYGFLHNGTNELTLLVNNSGEGPVSDFLTDLYVNDVWYSNNTESVGGYSQVNVSFNLTKPVGTYNLSFIVDPNDSQVELNESNNVLNTTLVIANTAPVIEFIEPASYANLSGTANLNVSIFDYDSDLNYSSVMYNIGNDTANYTKTATAGFSNLTNESLSEFSDTFNTSLFGDGSYSLIVLANDSINNEGAEQMNVNLDNTGPIVNLVTSDDSIAVNDDVTLTCTASDAVSGVKNVSMTAAGSLVCQSNITICVESVSFSSTGYKEIVCTSFDNAYNSATDSENVTVVSDDGDEDEDDGGGGGGAGGGSGNGQEKKVSHLFTIIEKNLEYKMTASSANIAFTEILFKVKRDLEDVKLTVQKLDTKPNGVSKPNQRVIYQYLEIANENLENIYVSDASIKFKIERDWISDNKIDETKIKLNRYYNEEWIALETTKLSSSVNYTYFKANTPGFSYFAVTAEQLEGAVELINDAPVIEDTRVIPEDIELVSELTQDIELKIPRWALLIIVVSISLVILYYYEFYKEKPKKIHGEQPPYPKQKMKPHITRKGMTHKERQMWEKYYRSYFEQYKKERK